MDANGSHLHTFHNAIYPAGCCFFTTPMEYLTIPCGYCLTILWFFRYNPTIVSDDVGLLSHYPDYL
jgi:hypothetical protein